MKLLVDENLSPRLVGAIVDAFPQSAHVRDVELRGADDLRIWNYAKAQGFIIVSKDTDFRDRSVVQGFPPKVIWLDVGNAGTNTIIDLLLSQRNQVEAFARQNESSMLILSIDTRAI